MTGLNRFMSGDASRVGDPPGGMQPAGLGGLVSAGVLWRGFNSRAVQSSGEPFLGFDIVYGDEAPPRSRTPYDTFGVRMRLGGGAAISDARVRGRLIGQPFRESRVRLSVTQAYRLHQ